MFRINTKQAWFFAYRFRRISLSSPCDSLDLSDVCHVMDLTGDICKVPAYIGNASVAAARETRKLLNDLVEFLRVGVNADLGFNASINASKSRSTIVSQVKEDLDGKSSLIVIFSVIFSQLMALSILYLFIKSSLYLRKYLTKETFDNKYITHGFYKYDAKRRKLGKKTVLPLSPRESKKYTDTTIPWPRKQEVDGLKKELKPYYKPIAITLCVFAADYVLYFMLLLINKYGAQLITISGASRINVKVLGSGVVAAYIKIFGEGIQLNDTYSASLNITYCLPTPRQPDTGTTILIVFLYVLGLCFIVLEVFGSRLRRKITAFFYPVTEFDRIRFLHAQIIHKRASLLDWLKQFLPYMRKGDVSEHISLSAMFYYRYPKFAAFCGCCNPEKIECMVCFKEDNGTTIFRQCAIPGCRGVYCKDCYKKARKNCMVCKGSKFKD